MKMMKNLIWIALITVFAACSSEPTSTENANDDNMILTSVVEDISNLKDVEEANPIELFSEQALLKADANMKLNKKNAEKVLEKAAEYKSCFVVVGNHTIVKIENLEDCQQSTSWGCCMPKAEGYIKKGDLRHEHDYLNNIIGRPDKQERMVYFFE